MPRRDAARGARRRARSTARPTRRCFGGRDPDRRHAPATSRRRTFGQACFEPGSAKNTYGTGCFLLLNTGATPVAVAERPAHDDRLEARRRGRPTASKARCSSPAPSCSGCATACASSRTSAEVERAGGDGARHRRRLPRAGLRRPRRAVLGSVRARHDRRPDARHAPSATSRGPRVESMAYQTRDVLDAMQRDAGVTLARAEGRRRRGRQQRADAVPGRPAGRRRCGGRWSRRRRPSAPPTWPAWPSATGTTPTTSRGNWALDREFTPQMDPDRRKALTRGWDRAVERSLHWIEPA